MKKNILFLIITVGICFAYIHPIPSQTEGHSEHQISEEVAGEMLKTAAFSLMEPYLQQSLTKMIENTKSSPNALTDLPAVCFAPDTDSKVVEDFYKQRRDIENSLGLPGAQTNSNFNLGSRWSTTASGGGLGQGDVTTLTWSYVPDGTVIGNSGCQVPGESSANSDFIAFFNGIYGAPTTTGDYTTAPWHAIFVNMFNSWSDVTGLNFIYEPNDDGATNVTSPGILGTRGDMRISGHLIDGNSGVLACNYFPNSGDMIIDTGDNYFMNQPGTGTTNVLTHEIGHGLGIQHVCPVNATKLMEPFVNTAFVGPQEDDILAANRHYGDSDGENDSPAQASFLGADALPTTYTKVQQSIDDDGETDYFSFTVSESSEISAVLTPTGTTYLEGVQNANGSCSAGTNFNALTIADLMFEVLDTDGTTVLASGDANGAGVAEMVAGVSLPVAGTYYVKVSQQGASIDSVQMYDLDLNLESVSLTPIISFNNPTGAQTEDPNLCFSDVSVPLSITSAPSANADVTFSISGTSTATSGLDYVLLTPIITFPSGSTSPKNLIIRVFHDGLVESDESVIIDFSVDANGGDATASTTSNSHILTISSIDASPIPMNSVTLYNEDFEDGSFNGTTSGNKGSDRWKIGNTVDAASTLWSTTGNSSLFSYTNDNACNCNKANDLLTTTSFSLAGSYTSVTLTFDHAFSNLGGEVGDVLVSTGGAFTSVQVLSNTSIPIGGGAYSTPWVNGVSVDLSSYIGQPNVQVRFRYNDGGGWLFGMAVDNILVEADFDSHVQTTVNLGTKDQIEINGPGTVYTTDNASGDVMLDITNNNAHNYGCTDIWVSRAGTGAQPFHGSMAPNLVMDKTFSIVPTNQASPGDVTVTFYFTEAEIAGWETAVGGPVGVLRNTLVAGRESAGNFIETSPLIINSFGSEVTLTGTFTGLEDTFYFGPLLAFTSTCPGATKIWTLAGWSPPGPPDMTNPVIINSPYSTSVDGNIDACTCVVNALLEIQFGTYINVHN